jgi:hypothetical protein
MLLVGGFGTYAHQKNHALLRNNNSVYIICPDPLANLFIFISLGRRIFFELF